MFLFFVVVSCTTGTCSLAHRNLHHCCLLVLIAGEQKEKRKTNSGPRYYSLVSVLFKFFLLSLQQENYCRFVSELGLSLVFHSSNGRSDAMFTQSTRGVLQQLLTSEAGDSDIALAAAAKALCL